MDTPSNDNNAPQAVTPAQEALTVLALNTGDRGPALDTLAE